MITTYLFDLDGTLIDTKIYKRIYPKVLKMIEKKLKIKKNEIEAKAKSFGLRKNKEKRYDSGDLCKSLFLLDEYYKILDKEIKTSASLKKDVKKILSELNQRKKKIGIVSNSMRRTIDLYIEKYGLSDNVDFIFSCDDASCRKDYYVFWEKLVMTKKISPRTCIVIGDNRHDDVDMPRKVGFNTFLVKKPKDINDVLEI